MLILSYLNLNLFIIYHNQWKVLNEAGMAEIADLWSNKVKISIIAKQFSDKGKLSRIS